MNGLEAPSMYPQTSAVRRAKKGMADSRAMAEQNERYNPVNPKSQLMKNYTGMGRCVGGSATPSMGLSQYRGGGFLEDMGKMAFDTVKKMNYKDIAKGISTGAKAYKAVNDVADSVGYKGRGKHTLKDHLAHPNKGYGKPSEAHLMGQHLSKHIHDLHGAGFWSDFGDGFKKGFTGTLDVLKPATAFIPGFNQVMDTGRSVVGWGHSEEQRAMEQMGKKRLGRSRNKSNVALLSGNVDGVRGGANTGAYEGHGHNNLMEGGAMLGQDGHGQRKKRVVGAGVSARASIVKKVMADQGLNMIQASKFVKEHNLYQK